MHRKDLKRWKKSGRVERERSSPFLRLSSTSQIRDNFQGYEKIKVIMNITYIFKSVISYKRVLEINLQMSSVLKDPGDIMNEWFSHWVSEGLNFIL